MQAFWSSALLRRTAAVPLSCAVVLAACAAPAATYSKPASPVPPPEAQALAVGGGEVDLVAVASSTCPAAEPGKVELGALFDEMSDLSSLATQSRPSFTTRLSSSFDRASSNARPGDPDWFANRDFVEASPDQPVVLLDTVGPGTVTRIWSANPSGTVRIYIDGATKPILEAPFASLLDGDIPAFRSPFAFEVANGHNLYFPIPFKRSCRITVQTDAKRFYYQVDYRHYPIDTRIESFSQAALDRADCQRQRTGARLELAQTAELPPRPATETVTLPIAPGRRSEHRVAAESGGSTIGEFRIQPSTRDPVALRGTILTMDFDGEQTVQAPLGDFFATGPGLSEVRSLPITVDPETGTLTARWPMPFRESAVIALTGASEQKFQVSVELAMEPREWTDDSLHFSARWHPTRPQKSTPASDWPLTTIQGTGKYVGTLLNVQNGDVLWWGEGDERIWVDGENFPSHFGTGTEDYFGYGWCSNERFTTGYIGQTQSSQKQNWGATSLYRFHIPDAIPFKTKLNFALEIKHWRKFAVPLAYDGIAYAYIRPGATLPKPLQPADFRLPTEHNPPLEMPQAHYTCGGD